MARILLPFFPVLLSLAFLPLPAATQPKGPPKVTDEPMIGGDTMKFVKVPKGTFWMGWSSYSKPPRQSKEKTIKQDFEIAAYTVTQRFWEVVMSNNPCWFTRKGGGKEKIEDVLDGVLDRFPVEMVTWNDAQDFIKELNKREKGKGWLYRLPTQAEWEYACRGAATSKEDCSFDYYFEKPSNDITSKNANISSAWVNGQLVKDLQLFRPVAVGIYKPNKLGIHDMHGNVRQWCDDQDGGAQCLRGGSFALFGDQCVAGFANARYANTYREYDVGFRVVRVKTEGAKKE